MATPKKNMLYVGNLSKSTTDEDLRNVFSGIGDVKRCIVVKNKDDDSCRGFGFISFFNMENTEKAIQQNLCLNGSKLRIQPAVDHPIPLSKEKRNEESKKIKKFAQSKKPRLIIRNTPFKADEKFLKKTFSQFGSVTEVTIPKSANGKKRGFAFVQFHNMKSAINAVKSMNAQQLLGRTIAVDFAVPKSQYEWLNSNKSENLNIETSVEEETEHESATAERPNKRKLDDFTKNDDDFSDYSENDQKNEKKDSSDSGNDSDEKHDDTDDQEEEVEASVSSDNENEVSEPKKKKPRKIRSNDASDGRTLFLRNVAFNTEQDDLREAMEKFGDVQYALLCIDRDTERPKGTAFVRFEKREDAEKCLHELNTTEGALILDGRQLAVSLALSQDEVKQQSSQKKPKGKDNRNLYLAREGLIRPGSEAAQGVSKGDLLKRMQRETTKRKLLGNLHNFVSSTRLCVHNLPFALDDSNLKKIFLRAMDDGSAKITEARIIKDLSGKSKGFGFVAFSDHEHALQALRALNNNPKIFTKQRRPVVEFSVENRRVLNIKEKRLENSQKNMSRKEEKVQNSVENSPLTTDFSKKKKQKLQKKNDFKKSKVQAKQINKNRNNSMTEENIQSFAGSCATEGIKKLPSHIGPKIRHKERKIIKNKQQYDMQVDKTKPKGKKKKIGLPHSVAIEEKKFEGLVEKYKKHLLSDEGQKKKKWFEEV